MLVRRARGHLSACVNMSSLFMTRCWPDQVAIEAPEVPPATRRALTGILRHPTFLIRFPIHLGVNLAPFACEQGIRSSEG